MRVIIGFIASIIVIVLGFLSIRCLFGFELSDVTAMEETAQNIAMSELMDLIPIPLPDFKILFYTLIAAAVYFFIVKKCFEKPAFSKLGLVACVLCTVLSCTPVGTYAPILGATIQSMRLYEAEATYSRYDEGKGYSISNKNVVIVKDSENPTITISGTLNNNTRKDWSGGRLEFWATTEDGSTGAITVPFDFIFEEIVPSGGSIDFELESPFFTWDIEKEDFTNFMVWKIEVYQ